MEISSSGMESQKAMRQPQLANVGAAIVVRQMPITRSDRNMPSVAVVWIQAVV